MRYFLILIGFVAVLGSCKKDDFTTAPQITYKSIEGNFIDGTVTVSSTDPIAHANVIFEVTDGEGDLGFNDGDDTAFIYIKSLLTNDMDSIIFPNLSSVSKKDFKFDVTASLERVTKCRPLPGSPPPIHTDTLFYEIYVQDFKKNKSNVIRTGDPVYFKCR